MISEPSWDPGGAEPFEAMLLKARRLAEVGRDDLAEPEYGRARALVPDAPGVLVEHAQCLLRLDRLDEARAGLEHCLAVAPEHAPAHLVLGALAMDEGRHTAAERRLLEGLRIDPESPLGFDLYALLMLKTEHLDKAERLARQALEIDPEYASAHGTLGRILAERRQGRAALAQTERGLLLAPEDESAHLDQAVAALRSGRPFEARRRLREVLRLAPRPEVEELYLDADRVCRWIYLPYYYYSLALERLPGGPLGLWVAFIAVAQGLRMAEVDDRIVLGVSLSWVAFALYTWIATPLVKLWTRLRPAR